MKWVNGKMASMAIVLAGMLMAVGCSQNEMVPRDVRVTLDDSLRNTSVQVDIIAVNDSEIDRWSKVPVDQYWPNGTLRQTKDKHVMEFTKGEGADSKVLSKKDPLWTTWKDKGAKQLVILAFIPGVAGSGEGQSDSRRIIMSLMKDDWEDLNEIKIMASKSGIQAQTLPKPPKRK